ncbi:MAG: cytochrome c [Gemmataceae bacterium]
MKSQLRIACGTALAGLCVWAAASAAPLDLPKDSAKTATAADIEALQKKLEAITAAPEKSKGAIRTAKGLVLTLGAYGDEAIQGQAAKVLLALDKKDYAGAAEAAKGLKAPKADADAWKAIDKKYDLEDVMSQFRLAKSGGMNIEKDIRDGYKGGNIDPKLAELIGARSAALGVYTEKMPNDKAMTNPAMKSKWEKFSKDMIAAGKELAEEAGKAKPDAKKLTATLKKLDASCSNCHNDFRNE